MADNIMIDSIKRCAEDRKFITVLLNYEHTERHLLPLVAGEKRFLSLIESDLGIDGYLLVDYKQVSKVYEAHEDRGTELARSGGLLDELRIPPADIDAEPAFFAYLANSGTNVEIEVCSEFSRETAIFPGRVVACGDYEFNLLRFTVNCLWEKRPVIIGYDRLRAVRFGASDLDIYSKYLPTCPMQPQ